jgi:hypothetical protein
MKLTPRNISLLSDVFKPLCDAFSFVIHIEDEDTFVLLSPHCVVRVVLERFGPGSEMVDPINPSDEHERYSYGTIMLLRTRHTLPQRTPPSCPTPEELEAKQKDPFLYEMCQLRESLLRYCSDLLSGDFSRIRHEGYHEWNAYFRDRIDFVMRLAHDDPIAKKFTDNDLTFLWDLWEREHPGEPRPVWW